MRSLKNTQRLGSSFMSLFVPNSDTVSPWTRIHEDINTTTLTFACPKSILMKDHPVNSAYFDVGGPMLNLTTPVMSVNVMGAWRLSASNFFFPVGCFENLSLIRRATLKMGALMTTAALQKQYDDEDTGDIIKQVIVFGDDEVLKILNQFDRDWSGVINNPRHRKEGRGIAEVIHWMHNDLDYFRTSKGLSTTDFAKNLSACNLDPSFPTRLAKGGLRLRADFAREEWKKVGHELSYIPAPSPETPAVSTRIALGLKQIEKSPTR